MHYSPPVYREQDRLTACIVTDVALLCVSQELNEEATQIFYATNRFRWTFDHLYYCDDADDERFISWPQKFFNKLPMMRHVIMEYHEKTYRYTKRQEIRVDRGILNLLYIIKQKPPRLQTLTLVTLSVCSQALFSDTRIKNYDTATVLRDLRSRVQKLSLVTYGPETAFSLLRPVIAAEDAWAAESFDSWSLAIARHDIFSTLWSRRHNVYQDPDDRIRLFNTGSHVLMEGTS